MRSAAIPVQAGEPDEINLTPLLDVVFIMLIFFIVTASFTRETGLPLGTTESDSATPAEPELILVVVDADNNFLIEDRVIDRRALRANLVRLHSRNPEWPVVVQVANDSNTQSLVWAVDAARAAGIDDVSVADTPPLASGN